MSDASIWTMRGAAAARVAAKAKVANFMVDRNTKGVIESGEDAMRNEWMYYGLCTV
jgi:hypothetical protein